MTALAQSKAHPARTLAAFTVLVVGLLATAARSHGQTFADPFDTDPFAREWQVTGDASLFRWNADQTALEVTWDSSRPNSFCHRSLGRVLTREDTFALTFTLRLTDLRVGVNPDKPVEFPIAIGLIQQSMTTDANVYRGTGVNETNGVRNLVEWDFYGDSGFGDTWSTTLVSSSNVFAYSFAFPLPLSTGTVYQVTLAYSASNQVLRTSALRNGEPLGPFDPVRLADQPEFAFAVDAFSVTSYSDAVQAGPAEFNGSVLAHAYLDDVTLTVSTSSPPPASDLAFERGGEGERGVSFVAQANWLHQLERSLDLIRWQAASPAVSGDGGRISLRDTNSLPADAAFYRVRSERTEPASLSR